MLRDRLLDPSLWKAEAAARPANVQLLDRDTIVPVPVERAFAFFSDARNLERMTPPWLNFHITSPLPIEMRQGALIDYRIDLYGIPIPWRTYIDVWEPGVRFVDRQIAGPYRWWRHEHRFESIDGGTRVVDRVEFVPRVSWASGWLVTRDVQRIFAYRQQVLAPLLLNT